MIRNLRRILGLAPDKPDPALEKRLREFSPEFSEGFSDRVLKRVHDESFDPTSSLSAGQTTEPFDAALLFAFRRISLAAVTLALALVVLDISKSDNSAILNSINADAPEIEEIIADPLFAQVE